MSKKPWTVRDEVYSAIASARGISGRWTIWSPIRAGAIVDHVRASHRVRAELEAFRAHLRKRHPNTTARTAAERAVDRALQALRRSGDIVYERPHGWVLASRRPS